MPEPVVGTGPPHATAGDGRDVAPTAPRHSCVTLSIGLTPLMIMLLGYIIGGVTHDVQKAGFEFSQGTWPRECNTFVCDRYSTICLESSAATYTGVLALLWCTLGVWHLIAIGVFVTGTTAARDTRNLAVCMATIVVLAIVGVVLAGVGLHHIHCRDPDGTEGTLHGLGHRLGHTFRVLTIDIAVSGAIFIVTAYFAIKGSKSRGDEDLEGGGTAPTTTGGDADGAVPMTPLHQPARATPGDAADRLDNTTLPNQARHREPVAAATPPPGERWAEPPLPRPVAEGVDDDTDTD